MKLITTYLFFVLGLLVYFSFILIVNEELETLSHIKPLLYCILAGGFGGVLYCLRSIYLNACVKKNWDADWHIWYYIRPINSLITGGASYVFLNAGLLILESKSEVGSSHLAYYSFAFIAGLNVDKFVKKLESIAKTTWGIEESRASGNNPKEGNDKVDN